MAQRPSTRKNSKAKVKKGKSRLHLLGRVHKALMAFLVFLSIAGVGLSLSPANAASTAADNGSRVTKEAWPDTRTLDLTVTSPSIDAPTKAVRLLLPTGWSKTSEKTWPTLWLLHGGGDDHTSWTKNTDIKKLAADRGVIVVIPQTSWCSAYSNWWNYGKYGSPAWESYITTDLPQILERGYRANTQRAVAGPSMGGLGTMKLAANHAGQFQAAASFSGNVDPLHSYNNTADGPDLPGLSCLSDWKRVWGDYKIPVQKAMWQQNDPYDQAAKLAALKYVFVSSGDGLADPLKNKSASDFVEKSVNTQSHAFVTKLESLGVPVQSHFYSGTHTWPYWQVELRTAFPSLMTAIGAQ